MPVPSSKTTPCDTHAEEPYPPPVSPLHEFHCQVTVVPTATFTLPGSNEASPIETVFVLTPGFVPGFVPGPVFGPVPYPPLSPPPPHAARTAVDAMSATRRRECIFPPPRPSRTRGASLP